MIAQGHHARLFRFDWQAAGTGLGACHCIDLPFLLGSTDAWRSAPALAGADRAEMESIGRRMRGIWRTSRAGSKPMRHGLKTPCAPYPDPA